jgi:sarcosine oxidase
MSGPHIAVIGLGAAGSAALYQLARRGIRSTAIEQFAPRHDRGSSHGPTRVIRLAHFENAAYVPLMRRAYTLWHDLEDMSRCKLVHRTGIVEIGPADGKLVRGTSEAARTHGLRCEILDAKALMLRHPQFRLPDNFMAVAQPDGGYLEAASAIETFHRVAAEAGATLRANEKALAIEPADNGVTIRTDHETIAADGVIVAAGPWMSRLLPGLNLPLRVTRQVVGWFEPDDVANFSDSRFPVFLIESAHGVHYGFPARGPAGIKVSKHHHLGEVVDPESRPAAVNDTDIAAIRTALADYLPGANGRLLSAQTCLYTMTPDDTFIIDRMPGFPHVVFASPCCGHGFKFAPVIGEIVADLATRGTTANDISQFQLRRFAQASARP